MNEWANERTIANFVRDPREPAKTNNKGREIYMNLGCGWTDFYDGGHFDFSSRRSHNSAKFHWT